MMTDIEVAKVAHQVNKAYCEALGDTSQVDWNEAPEWQQDSAIRGVAFHRLNPTAGAEASHESWMKEKLADGWKYGVFKDEKLKEHPCIVAFSNLPVAQQAKDYIFREIVHALS
jgi:hypothetical protein